MRESEAAVAIIRSGEACQPAWLARWNDRWQAYHFVAGHRRSDETFRQCLIRELGEELRLAETTDYQAPRQPITTVEFVGFSERAQVETRYKMLPFHVELTETARSVVGNQSEVRWLSLSEIIKGQSNDGQRVSPTMRRLIEAMDREGLGDE
jgi:8-oxo-dGTP pyrophosphatase MutT (NUDIX family)